MERKQTRLTCRYYRGHRWLKEIHQWFDEVRSFGRALIGCRAGVWKKKKPISSRVSVSFFFLLSLSRLRLLVFIFRERDPRLVIGRPARNWEPIRTTYFVVDTRARAGAVHSANRISFTKIQILNKNPNSSFHYNSSIRLGWVNVRLDKVRLA